ncbi:MAG: HAD-IIB family hydrolase [Eubacterium sp.]|nr:HAD-IIB family hydrolase [Eubacterium sp.]
MPEITFPDNIQLIASDLDGTLLQNDAQKLQPGTCDLIHTLTTRGILFLAASGRQYANLQRLFAPVKDEIAYLCENGCLSFYKGRMIHQVTMDHALGQEMIRAILEHPTAEVLLSGKDTSYLQPKDMQYYYHMRDVVGNNVTLVPDILETEEPYFKISIYEKGGLTDEEIAYWKQRFGDRATVVTGGNDWLDMMPKHVDKGTGMLKMLRELNISPDACMAFGDNNNDTEMLRLVGWPVAVDNAKPEILAMCRDHTPTVESYLRSFLSVQPSAREPADRSKPDDRSSEEARETEPEPEPGPEQAAIQNRDSGSDILYIVIPAYNEAANISRVIEDWYPVVEEHDGGGRSRLIVIDDGSTDSTHALLQKLAQDRPLMLALTKKNQGHGPAVRFGYRYAVEHGSNYVFQTDADGQTLASEFENFWNKRAANDMVIGWRRHREDGWNRRLVTRVLRFVIRLTFHCDCADANTPFRLIRTPALRQCLPYIPEDFFLSNVLLTVLLTKKEFRVTYLPVTFRPRQGGKNSIDFRKIMKIGWKAFFTFHNINRQIEQQDQQTH